MNASTQTRPAWLEEGTKVFHKDNGQLICSYVETKDAVYARQHVHNCMSKEVFFSKSLLSLVRLDNSPELRQPMRVMLLDWDMLKQHYSEYAIDHFGEWHELRQVPWSKVVWC
jgi:hypothetical protein